MSQQHIQKHIDMIAEHEQRFLAERTSTERIGDAISGVAGGLKFVGAHVLILGVWVAINMGYVRWIKVFDPAPFPLLGTIVAVEALLLASFILMRQSRVGRRAEERDHLVLQLLLLTERELTALLELNRQIAKRIGLEKEANSAEIRDLSQHTSIEDVAQTIKESMPVGTD